jgi:DNA mismatch endonuclease (patch repair protein)
MPPARAPEKFSYQVVRTGVPEQLETAVEPFRSALMRRVSRKNSKPEVVVRRELHRRGYRYTLHSKKLPGSPDIVFSARRKVVFIHGCFWHRHPGCLAASSPRTRIGFWEAKFAANMERDRRAATRLKEDGWEVYVVWECDIKRHNYLAGLLDFLGPPCVPHRQRVRHHDLSYP